MGHNEQIIRRMQAVANGNGEYGEQELRAIASQSNRIARDMVANHGMDWSTAHQLWENAQQAAKKHNIAMPMPTIVDTQALTANVLSGGMVNHAESVMAHADDTLTRGM